MSLVNREHGLVTYIDTFMGHTVYEVPMTVCAHCGGAFPLPKPFTDKSPMAVISRKGRGFCFNHGKHGAWICGPSCAECIDWKKKLAIEEGHESPTAVSVVPNAKASKLWLPFIMKE